MSSIVSRSARLALGLLLLLAPSLAAQRRVMEQAPDRRAGEGEGPFSRLIIRGVTMVDGTGAPPVGPVDIVIENDRIARVVTVGYPKVPIDPRGRPQDATREIDATGMYALPGFVDLHAHMGGLDQGTTAEYVYKLWLAHGVTTIRDPGCINGVDWCLEAKRRSAANRIVAPRIYPYFAALQSTSAMGLEVGDGYPGALTTPEEMQRFVRWVKEKGGDGIKVLALDPELMTALLAEAKQQGIGVAAHLSQLMVARFDALEAARAGLTTLEHWYGLPESLFESRALQDYPANYNYQDESHRFGEAGRLWKQAAAPGSPKWQAVMDEFLGLDFVFDPTLTIYEASRDYMRARTAEWHETYTLPSLWRFYQPSRVAHGSYWFDWTTRDEIEWKENYRLWMRFLNEYKNRGGKVCTGSDSGFIYKLYGFDYVRELELLQEAGFSPLEVIRAATLCGAETIARPTGERPQFGIIRAGMLADLVLVPENPLQNFKVLYGTGHVRVDDQTGKAGRVGGVKYTIKDGIVYDAKRLLADVAAIVAAAKQRDPTEVRTAAPQR
ncbi:MAG: amidohydrolase family protein [Gemmatimonadales bacterium]